MHIFGVSPFVKTVVLQATGEKKIKCGLICLLFGFHLDLFLNYSQSYRSVDCSTSCF